MLTTNMYTSNHQVLTNGHAYKQTYKFQINYITSQGAILPAPLDIIGTNGWRGNGMLLVVKSVEGVGM